MLLSLETALLASCLTIFLNYIIGKPGSEFSPYEIFSSYTVWLSKKRLKKLNLFYQYDNQCRENLRRALTNSDRLRLENDFKIIIYSAAEPFFAWERMVGMCSVCTGFWISLITGICFYQNFVYLLSVIVFSHIIIRVINKIL